MRAPRPHAFALGPAFALVLAACSGAVDPGPTDGAPLDARATDARVVLLPDAGDPLPDGGAALGAPYPIVLAHGFFGFEEFAGLDFATYFYEVRAHLMTAGEPLVYTPSVDPFNDSTTRGEALAVHVRRILEETGHARVNLIGHSQGGLDARYVASVYPELVSSVTTYATPNRGTPIADIVLGLVEDTRLRSLADRLVALIGAPLYDAAGEETSVMAALEQMGTPGITAFNTAHPNAPDVAYYSVTGRTDRSDGRPECDATDRPPFISRWDGTLDPVDPLLDIPEQIVDGGSADVVNDGLVRVEDARWGRFLGCVPADHLDQVGHLFGDSAGFGNEFDHRAFFADLVAFLRSEGH